MEKISVRNATNSDVNLLYLMANENPPLDLHTLYTYWIICNHYSDTTLVLEVDGKPEAFASAITTPNCIFFWQLAVNKEFRGQGFPVVLMEKLCEIAKKKNLDVQLTISPDNQESYKCLSKFCNYKGYKFEYIGKCVLNNPLNKNNSHSETIENVYAIKLLEGDVLND